MKVCKNTGSPEIDFPVQLRFGYVLIAHHTSMTIRSILGSSNRRVKPVNPYACLAKDWQIKKRRPVRRKHIAPLLKDLEDALCIDLAVDGAFLEMADYGPWKMVLVDRVPLAVG